MLGGRGVSMVYEDEFKKTLKFLARKIKE